MQDLKKEPIIYYGYYFYESGKVCDSKGKEVTPNIDKYGNRSILLLIPDKRNVSGIKKRRIYIARTIYNLFNDTKLPSNMVICYKDGNKGNYSVTNLAATRKTSTFHSRVLSSEQVEEILSLYNNKDNHFHSQWNKSENDYSIRDLAQKYNVSAYTIQRVIGGTYHCSATVESLEQKGKEM